jgi:hypothetical protein
MGQRYDSSPTSTQPGTGQRTRIAPQGSLQGEPSGQHYSSQNSSTRDDGQSSRKIPGAQIGNLSGREADDGAVPVGLSKPIRGAK